jgi:hypothetical protein
VRLPTGFAAFTRFSRFRTETKNVKLYGFSAPDDVAPLDAAVLLLPKPTILLKRKFTVK